jgi:hypothetical protein
VLAADKADEFDAHGKSSGCSGLMPWHEYEHKGMSKGCEIRFSSMLIINLENQATYVLSLFCILDISCRV